jgi:hypothetical protein
MQLEPRRLEGERVDAVGSQVERGLMRRARTRRRDRSAEANLRRAVNVSAEHALDLRVAGDHALECVAAVHAHLVDVRKAGDERRVMHHHQRARVRPLRKRAVEPREAFVAHVAARAARNHRIERNEPQRQRLDRVLDELAGGRQVRLVGECAPKFVELVVVAGNHVVRRSQVGEDFAQVRIRVALALVGKVAGDQNRVGPRIEPIEVRNRLAQHARGVDALIGAPALGHDVQIGDLREQHRPFLLAGMVFPSGRHFNIARVSPTIFSSPASGATWPRMTS